MNQTPNYQLPQWVESDRILMEDFNNAMRIIDSDILRCVHTSYVGSGEHGTSDRNYLTFPARPVLIMLAAEGRMVMTTGLIESQKVGPVEGSDNSVLSFNWEGNTLSWVNTHSAIHQFNAEGVTYHCYAFYLKVQEGGAE